MGNVESLTGSLHTSWMEAFPKEKNSERIFVLTSVTSDANEIPLEICNSRSSIIAVVVEIEVVVALAAVVVVVEWQIVRNSVKLTCISFHNVEALENIVIITSFF
ncbi:hypothetical protein HZH66_004700 [Vespula vulgaris]|uniref:Uncharacterized protein n=1 Tax=Vespula vulgaris TaxID=7454 RepID=A0A834K9B8_VESVU|nr:hypothetical protein HZH66_004700 [Vespula vulgaris]